MIHCLPMVALAVHGLGKSFGSRAVLKNLTLDLQAGEMLVVRGHNGSGKSTLLKVLAGLLAPTAGRVEYSLHGKDLTLQSRFSALGFISPELELYDLLTPGENLALFARLRGLSPDRNQDLLDSVGLADRSGDLVGTLSTGLRQRLHLAFALQGDPWFLFLDEPTANLDADGRALVTDSAAGLRSRGGIVVMATNNPDEGREERELVLG